MNELKPCPFCGGEAYEKYRDVVNCKNDNCFIQYTDFDIEGWNTRAIDPRLRGAVEEMQKDDKTEHLINSEGWRNGWHYGMVHAEEILRKYFPELKEE